MDEIITVNKKDISLVKARVRLSEDIMAQYFYSEKNGLSEHIKKYIDREIIEGLVNEVIKNNLVDIKDQELNGSHYIMAEFKILKKKADK